MEDIQKTLRALGLKEREAEVYLLLLRIGTAPASVIARRLSVPKSTLKYTCERLAEKGFIRMMRKGTTHVYIPQDPDQLLQAFAREHEAVSRREDQLKRIAEPLRRMISPVAALPTIQFYEGAQAVLQATIDLVRATPVGGEILRFVRPLEEEHERHLPLGSSREEVTERFETEFQERMRRRIRERMIVRDSPLAREWVAEQASSLGEARVVHPSLIPDIPGEIILSGERMLASSANKGAAFAYRLEHESIVPLHRAMFELAWKAAETAG